MMRHRATLLEIGLIGVVALLVTLLHFRATVSNANSDPRLSLLVSLALWEEQTIRLDSYIERTVPPLTDPSNQNQLSEFDGHLYYDFPIGTAIVAMPAVVAAELLGRDMLVIAEQNSIANGLAALSSGLLTLLTFGLARCYLSRWPALLVTAGLILGSSMSSSLGGGLWSHHLALAANLLILLLLHHPRAQQWLPWSSWLIGLLLFFAYLARPAQAVFIIVILGWFVWRQRPYSWRVALAAALPFGLFLLFSLNEHGTLFPPYYSPERLDDFVGTPLWQALLGLTLSPSRGLFVFHPYLILVGLGLLLWWRRWPQRDWLLVVGLWFGLQLLLVSRAVVWWGGASYGPRLLLDVWAGVMLLCILFVQQVWQEKSQAQRVGWLGAWLALTLIAVWVHVAQGLYNRDTQRWNVALQPTVNEQPEIIFDWRYPQWRSSQELLCQRNETYLQATLDDEGLAAIRPQTATAGSEPAGFYPGWSNVDPTVSGRWSECPAPKIWFNVVDVGDNARLLSLQLSPLSDTATQVRLNGETLVQVAAGQELVMVEIPAGLLRNGRNELQFDVPNAATPLTQPPYRTGIGLIGWSLSATN